MQLETRDTVDHQAMAPLLRGAVGPGVEPAVEDSETDGAFEIKREVPLGSQRPDHRRTAALPPQPFKDQRRTELAGGDGGRVALLIRGQHDGAAGKARRRAQSPVEGAVLRQLIDAAEGGDDGVARFAGDAVVLDNLEIFGAAGDFAAKEHAGVCVSTTTFIATRRGLPQNATPAAG